MHFDEAMERVVQGFEIGGVPHPRRRFAGCLGIRGGWPGRGTVLAAAYQQARPGWAARSCSAWSSSSSPTSF